MSGLSRRVFGEGRVKASMNLPKTTFPLRGRAPTADDVAREAAQVDKLTTQLYRRQLAKPRTTPNGSALSPGQGGDWVLQDGPPYANGSLHIGHFLNKVIKDVANRHAMVWKKQRVVYRPGWDCHGLPIELKVVAELAEAAKKAAAGVPGGAAQAPVSPADLRRAARDSAVGAIRGQAADFKRWGVLADWELPPTVEGVGRGGEGTFYVTMDPAYEATQLRVFQRLVEKGFVHRALKPVYWSPSSQTALAEAELEYTDAHASQSAFIAFPLAAAATAAGEAAQAVLGGFLGPAAARPLHALVWTTTPWTIPANVAISVHPEFSYAIAAAGGGAGPAYLVATDRLPELQRVLAAAAGGGSGGDAAAAAVEVLATLQGRDLAGALFAHPMRDLPPVPELAAQLGGATSGPRVSPVLCGTHVTNDSGTGLVHTAPGHGHDDFAVCGGWRPAAAGAGNADALAAALPACAQAGLPTLCPVDNRGCFAFPGGGAATPLHGLPVLSAGNEAVLAALAASGSLLHTETYTHRYPYDWRTKKPVIIRATKQWFVDIAPLTQPCRDAIGSVDMVPAASRNRLASMIGSRTEWCISRQRAWGTPIPVLYDAATDEPLMTPEVIAHIASVVEAEGTDAWWSRPAEAFLPPALAAAAAANGTRYVKGGDTLDVWFDSGVAWAAGWAHQPTGLAPASGASGGEAALHALGGRVADMVVEGSDQHRGWFQSLLITAVAASTDAAGQGGVAPYKRVVTHGFVLDEAGRKMSKSLGNVVAPADVINGKGAAGGSGAGGKKGGKAGSKGSAPGAGAGAAAATAPPFTGYGVDVLRQWVASSDYSRDVVIGPGVITTIAESVRKLRNTGRFLLGNLAGFNPYLGPAPAPASNALLAAWSSPVAPPLLHPSTSLRALERGLLHRLHAYAAEVASAYDAMALMRVVQATNTLLAVDLSAQYFDFSKDTLYADARGQDAAPSSGKLPPRLAVQAVLWETLRLVTRAIAPVTPFTAQDFYHHSAASLSLGGAPAPADASEDHTAFDVDFPEVPAAWHDPVAGRWWTTMTSLREETNRALEAARAAKHIGSALEARLTLTVEPGSALAHALAALQADEQLEDAFLTSQVEVVVAPRAEWPASAQNAAPGVVTPVPGAEGASWGFTLRADVAVPADAPPVADAPPAAPESVWVVAAPAAGHKCSRCWKYREEAQQHEDHLCFRCEDAVAAATA